MIQKCCETCGDNFSVIRARAVTAKYCSTGCRDIGLKKAPNQTCIVCEKKFHMKQSQINRYARELGTVCSYACSGVLKAKAFLGENNPNYKGRNTDQDGYRIYSPPASYLLGLKRMKLHQAICCESLGIQKIPKGFHVHHRDCDIENNTPNNLVVLTPSEHKWLHKQYGVATLWAYMHTKVSLESLINWSDDKEQASKLLALDVTQQHASHLFKE